MREQAVAVKTETIHVPYLARVEGEGALYVRYNESSCEVEEVRLDIFEPPRFFEAFLVGRSYTEVPDITARICGICPVAYQMSSAHALEQAFGMAVGEPYRTLRRLLYCGEWIESHVLHMFLLHAPDFLGYESAIAMAQDHPELVKKVLRLKKLGNDIVATLGGREIHPINVRVGGFYSLPRKSAWNQIVEELKWGLDFAEEATHIVAGLPIPELIMDYEFMALSHPSEYPFNEGVLATSKGLRFDASEFYDYVEEIHVSYANALHSRLRGRGPYITGPLARVNINRSRLSPRVQSIARDVARKFGITFPNNNNFTSIVARALETVQALEEALAILQNYDKPEMSFIPVQPKAGIGHAATEAPRGTLYHRYEMDENGLVKKANIAPPTAQNQMQIEADLRAYAPTALKFAKPEATLKFEQLIRNYDPCISCATHFLRLNVERIK
jgi:coenzyme F420-reducing hydrogenase alpha subunit